MGVQVIPENIKDEETRKTAEKIKLEVENSTEQPKRLDARSAEKEQNMEIAKKYVDVLLNELKLNPDQARTVSGKMYGILSGMIKNRTGGE